MNITPQKTVENLRKEYPIGCKVKLLKMDDVQAPPIGTIGTVRAVDDMGTIHVNWEHGGSLGVVYGEDKCQKIDTVTTICYGEEKQWTSREDAKEYFYEAMLSTEGSEHDRYESIYTDIILGKDICRDIND